MLGGNMFERNLSHTAQQTRQNLPIKFRISRYRSPCTM